MKQESFDIWGHTNASLSGTISSLILAVVILAFGTFAVDAQQQQTARPDRGINPNGTYQASGLDAVNMLNGNVTLKVPLASLPPIAGGKLSYTLNAYYNSKLVNVTRTEGQAHFVDDPNPCPQSYDTEDVVASDLGGWRIEGTYQIIYREARDEYEYISSINQTCDGDEAFHMTGKFFKPILVSPDGAEHELRLNDPNYAIYAGNRPYMKHYYKYTGSGFDPTFSSGMRMSTIDGTYMTIVVNAPGDPVKWTMYMKDGTRVIQDQAGGQRIKDTNNNSILITSGSAKDEGTGREIKWSDASYDGEPATKIEYQSVGGGWEAVYVVWGQTHVRGKLYRTTTWDPETHRNYQTHLCSIYKEFAQTFDVVREIVLPATEIGAEPKKISFSYNSDTMTTGTTEDVLRTCSDTEVAEDYTRTVSTGMGELSRVELPGGAVIEYDYAWDGRHTFDDWGEYPAGMGGKKLARNVITEKHVEHDGQTNTWTYTLGTSAVTGQGSVTNPDGSSSTEYFYPTDAAYSRTYVLGQDGGLSYASSNSGLVSTRKKWTAVGATTTFGSTELTSVNSLIDSEFTTMTGPSNESLTKAVKYEYDKNGEVTQAKIYDWYPTDSQNPDVIPSSAALLRTTNSSYYNQSSTVGDPSYYSSRTVGNSTVILGALKETTLGPGTSRFSYDGQSYGVAPTAGNLTKTSAWDDVGNQWIDSLAGYDSYGNVTSKTDPSGNTSYIYYGDSTHAMPTSTVVDPQNGTGAQTASTTYDFYTGLPLTSTDINGNTSYVSYINHLLGAVDPFGRPGTVYGPYIAIDGVNQRQTVKTFYEDIDRRTRVESDLFAEGDALIKARETRDQLGRTILSEKNEDGASDYTISSRMVYDTANRVVFSSNPMRAGETTAATNGWTRVTSDLLGRPIEMATFAGATLPPVSGTNTNWTGSMTTAHSATTTTVTDQAGRQRRSVTNAINLLTRLDEPDYSNQLGSVVSPNQATYYSYNESGSLTQVSQGVQTRTFLYSSLSRLKQATNPESGTIQYSFDKNGNLIEKTDARNVVTSYTYDALNRLLLRSYSGEPGTQPSTPAVGYTYDNLPHAKGKLTKISSDISATEFAEFDIVGRATASKQTTDGREYPMTYVYGFSGSLVEQTYPSGRTVKNIFDNGGDLSAVQSKKNPTAGYWNYAENFKLNSAGAVVSLQLGNGKWESTEFNSRLQPTRIALGNTQNASNLLKLDYSYGTTQNNGNILSQTITVPDTREENGFTAVQNYTYDSLNRIKSAAELIDTNQSWMQTFQYDRYGNRTLDEANTTTLTKNCGSSPSFTVCAPDRKIENPEVLSSNNRIKADQDGDTVADYIFDSGGNTRRTANGLTYVYDGENKQIEARNAANQLIGQYYYDGDGKRVKKVVSGTGETTVFVYDAGGKLIAEYSTVLAEKPQAAYTTSDHLGSSRINTSADGAVMARHDYYPFGEEIDAVASPQRIEGLGYKSDEIRKKFTGYERDGETGLDFAQARYFNSQQGRFSTPDSFVNDTHTVDPQSWNLYAYVRNNPFKYVDRDGREIILAIQGQNYIYTNKDGIGNLSGNGGDTKEGKVALALMDRLYQYRPAAMDHLIADGQHTINISVSGDSPIGGWTGCTLPCSVFTQGGVNINNSSAQATDESAVALGVEIVSAEWLQKSAEDAIYSHNVYTGSGEQWDDNYGRSPVAGMTNYEIMRAEAEGDFRRLFGASPENALLPEREQTASGRIIPYPWELPPGDGDESPEVKFDNPKAPPPPPKKNPSDPNR